MNEFARSVTRFAGIVQEAFTLADDAMLKDSNVLDDLHVSLLKHIGAARQRRRLSAAEDQTLSDQLDRAEHTKKHLIEVLDGHHNWQQQHDRLDMLNGFRKTQAFDEQLANYLDNHLPQLTFLLESEKPTPPQTDDGTGTVSTLIENCSCSTPTLPTWLALQACRSSTACERRSTMFYQIDKRTLGEVERSAQAVRDLENELATFAKKHSEVA